MREHHPSCRESDKSLVWHCNQCGLNESAESMEDELNGLKASIADLSHPNCQQLLADVTAEREKREKAEEWVKRLDANEKDWENIATDAQLELEKVERQLLETQAAIAEYNRFAEDNEGLLRHYPTITIDLPELAKFKKDTERMDWLENAIWNHPDYGNGLALFPFTKNTTGEKGVNVQGLGDEDGSNLGEEISEGSTLRASLDDAMK